VQSLEAAAKSVPKPTASSSMSRLLPLGRPLGMAAEAQWIESDFLSLREACAVEADGNGEWKGKWQHNNHDRTPRILYREKESFLIQ
jgi:hypothetical protein